MLSVYQRVAVLAIAGSSAFISGCGGSGGGDGGGTSATPALGQFSGVAASGSAVGNASVTTTNHSSASPCVESPITTTPLGSYTCTVKAGETAPFFIVVTDPTGNTLPLVSIATTAPAAGSPLTVNATPLTTAIVAQLNGGDALGVVADKSINSVNLQALH
jgi:hypothetical protein